MEQQNKEAINPQNIGFKIALAVIISTFIAAVAAGGVVWFWKNRKMDEMKKSYERRIESLVGGKAVPAAESESLPADSSQNAAATARRESDFKEELAKKYNIGLSDVVSLAIEKETDSHLQGIFSYRVSGGGEMRIAFLAAKNPAGSWSIVYDGDSFSSLMRCDLFRQYLFPDDFKNFSDCDITEFSGLRPEWKLISGNPRQDCSRTVYEGEATVRGWYEWDYVYVEKDWVFHVVNEDIGKITTKLDNKWYWSYRLADAPKDLEARLKKASREKPVEVTLRGLSFYCEGIAGASLAPGSSALQGN